MPISAEKFFPFDHMAEVLTRWRKPVEWCDNGLTWLNGFGRSELIFVPGKYAAPDGVKIAGYIECRHMLLQEASKEITGIEAALWNRRTSLSALLPARPEQPPQVLSRVSVIEGDKQAMDILYGPLFANESYMQPLLFASIAENAKDRTPEYFGLEGAGEDPPYGEEDFGQLQVMLQESGYLATHGSDGVTVEFPWDPGAVSHMLSAQTAEPGDPEFSRTALCQMSIKDPHPFLGHGLLTTLHLPLPVNDNQALGEVVTQLNQIEATGIDMPPFFGAWCVGQGGRPAFVSFVPNELLRVGLHSNVMSWMAERVKRVPRWLEEIVGGE